MGFGNYLQGLCQQPFDADENPSGMWRIRDGIFAHLNRISARKVVRPSIPTAICRNADGRDCPSLVEWSSALAKPSNAKALRRRLFEVLKSVAGSGPATERFARVRTADQFGKAGIACSQTAECPPLSSLL